MKGEVEWDEVVNIACDSYSLFRNNLSHESALFLIFRREIYIPAIENLLQPKL